MADIHLKNTYTGLDADYAQRKLDAEWAAFLRNQAMTGEPAPGEDGEGPAPTTQPEPEKPSAVGAGAQAGLSAAGAGVMAFTDGLRKLLTVSPVPEGASFGEGAASAFRQKVEASRQIIMDGLMQLGWSPVTGAAVGVGQALENSNPEAAGAELFKGGPGGPAFTARHLLMGAPAFGTLTPEQIRQMSQPMTVREALEALGPELLPFAVKPVMKAGAAVAEHGPKALKSQRGAVGDLGAAGPPDFLKNNPHVWREGSTAATRAAAFDALPPDAEVWVFHGTDKATAADMVAQGIDPAKKPRSLGRERMEAGEEARFSPGAGLGAGLYVGTDPFNVEGFGRSIIAIRVKKSDLSIPPEQASLGERSVGTALALSDAQVLGAIPADRIKEVTGADVHRLTAYEATQRIGGAGPPAVPPTGGGQAPPGGAEPPGDGGAGSGRRGTAFEQSRLNPNYINAATDTKRLMQEISARIGAQEPAKTARERVTHAETIERAKQWPLEKLLAVAPDDVRVGDLNAVKLAARDSYNAAAEHLMDIAKRLERGDMTAEADFYPAQAVAVKLAELMNLATETGRALEAQKIHSEATRVAPIDPAELLVMAEKMRSAQGNVPPRTAAARIVVLETAAQRRSYLASLGAAYRTGLDFGHSLWINSLLTNPATHFANVVGTTLRQGVNLPEHYVAEITNRLFFRDPEGVQRGETAAMIRAIPEGAQDAIRLMGKAWKLEAKKDTAGLSAIDADLLGTGRMEIDNQHLPVALRLPTIALGIEDAGQKAIAFRMNYRALAHREAMAEGRKGQAFAGRVTEIEAHPERYPALMKAAVDEAMLLTLNSELGPIGQAFMHLANLTPGGRVVMPFIRTPTNIAKFVGQRAPILAQISRQNRTDIMAGGAARDKAIARQAIGAVVSVAVAWEVMNGNITGSGTRDRNLRTIEKEERPPCSVKVGEKWYGINRLDPVGGLVCAVADYVEMAGSIPTQDEWDEWGAYAATLGLAVGNVMINKTYMRGLSDALDAIKDPTRDAGKMASGFARSIVPAGVRAVTRELDDHIVRDARTLVDSIKSGIPYLSGDVPPTRNPITGEPVRYPPGWGPDLLSPVYVTEKKNDPVFEAVIEHKISLPLPPRHVHGQGKPTSGPLLEEPKNPAYKLSPEQYDDWLVGMTRSKIGDQTLYERLRDYVTSDRYRDEDRGTARAEQQIKAIYSAYRDKGWIVMLKAWEDELKPALDAHDRAKLDRLRPRTDPRSPAYPGAVKPAPPSRLIQGLTR